MSHVWAKVRYTKMKNKLIISNMHGLKQTKCMQNEEISIVLVVV